MNKPQRVIHEEDEDFEPHEHFPLDTMKHVYDKDYGTHGMLDDVIPVTDARQQKSYKERELNLIKEMQEGSESDEKDSFLERHGSEEGIRSSEGE